MFFGLLVQRTRWTLTWRAWVALLLFATALGFGVVTTIYPFLAVTERAKTDTLVMEGWVNEAVLRATRDEFVAGGYREVFTTGGPLTIVRSTHEQASTAAEFGALRLRRIGLHPSRIHSAPAPFSERDRTFAAAVALRDRLRDHRPPVARLNVVTHAVHARRTRLLFQRALGPDVTVGIIAAPTQSYDPARWWRSSEGVRDVLGGALSYGYARIFFSARSVPETPASTAPAS